MEQYRNYECLETGFLLMHPTAGSDIEEFHDFTRECKCVDAAREVEPVVVARGFAGSKLCLP